MASLRTAPITEDEARDWLNRYGRAWEAGDRSAVLRLFTPDAAYHETPFAPPMIGHDAIGSYWQEGAVD